MYIYTLAINKIIVMKYFFNTKRLPRFRGCRLHRSLFPGS